MKEVLLEVVSNKEEGAGIFRLDLACPEKLNIRGGQFLNIQAPDSSLILRRPFCIYDYKNGVLTLFIAVIGKGTTALSKAQKGQKLRAVLPLGNGFDVSAYQRIGLLGGGMGAAALHMIASSNPQKEFSAYLGFANKNRVLFEDDYKRACKKVVICTSDGSYGLKGYATTPLIEDIGNLDAVLICGPHGLVKSAQSIDCFKNLPVFVSMEQRMACGIGACLVCTCALNDGTNKRVCSDGPVFRLDEVKL